jgi:hypothetical protein
MALFALGVVVGVLGALIVFLWRTRPEDWE